MKLKRTRTFWFISAAWMMLFIIIFTASRTILLNSFNELEIILAKDNANRVYTHLLTRLEYISHITTEGSYWDAAFHFMKNHNKKFIEENFNRDEFLEAKLNYVAFISNHNKIIWGKGYDLSRKAYKPLPYELKKILTRANLTLEHKSKLNDLYPAQSGFSGIININNQLVLISLDRIYDENEDYPSNGILMYGRDLTPLYMDALSKNMGFNVAIVPLNKENQGVGVRKAITTLGEEGKQKFIYINDEKTLSVYQSIKNIDHEPVALLRINIPRHLYLQSKKTAVQNMVLLIIFSMIGVISMIVIIYIFFKKQESITGAFERFFPKEFVKLLNKADIEDIAVGNSKKQNITILFTDIRNFIGLSERLTSNACFEFINEFLSYLAPAISRHDGFIDKYIGDAIMAIFHKENNSANDAVDAAIEIINQLRIYNAAREVKNQDPINIGIGVNTGNMMLGIVGDGKRLNGTVISDTVNTASRIESVTKIYQSCILISEQTYGQIDKEAYSIRFIDRVMLKGKHIETPVYEVYDNDSEKVREQKEETLRDYLVAWELYNKQESDKAIAAFKSIIEKSPEDNAAKAMLDKCQQQKSKN